jgi:hypothetical protein
MHQDRHAKLINYLSLAMIPDKGETVVDLPPIFSMLWVMFVETKWHARRWTSHSLYAAKTGTQRPMSVLLIALRMILFFSLSRRTEVWNTGCPTLRELSL